MKILVCIKQVPGTNKVEVDPETGVLQRDGVESKLNPYDLFALEMGFELAERHGGQVEALTMGPPQAVAAVAEAVYMGAENGAVVSDRAFAGADVLATSYTLSQAVRRLGDFDLILCGKQTTDGDTAQVGAEMAEFLGLPHAANVTAVEEISAERVTVRCELDRSVVRQSLPLPCLLCAGGDINSPRLPSYKRRKSRPNFQPTLLSLEDLGDREAGHYGLEGSPTQVERIFPPQKSGSRQMLTGDNAQLAAALAGLLRERKFV